MGIRRVVAVVTLALLPAAAHADRHDYEAFGGITLATGSALWGGQFSVAKTLPFKKPAKREKEVQPHHWSLVADISHQAGFEDEARVSRMALLTGVRYTGHLIGGETGICWFLQVLAGHLWLKDPGLPNRKGLGSGFGGAFEFLRDRHGGLRLQLDVLFREDFKDRFFRISGGVVYRFEKD